MGVGSLLPPCESPGLNSSCQVGGKSPYPMSHLTGSQDCFFSKDHKPKYCMPTLTYIYQDAFKHTVLGGGALNYILRRML